MDVATVVVTYNRLELLKENIHALLNQSECCDILLIDNASTDGTKNYIDSLNEPRIKYFNTGANLGGAGGFAKGIGIGEALGYRYLWIMDDDSIPESNALRSLVDKARLLKDEFSFLSSLVYWIDGTLFPMNLPNVDYKNQMDVEFDKISKYKVAPIQSASFVGCFVNTEISKKSGLPISEFFIYGDDVEYTNRLRKKSCAYLDLDSVIIHKAPSKAGADIAVASADRIDRFYYQSRNGMYIARKKGVFAVGKRLYKVVKRTINILRSSNNCKLKRLAVLYKGTIAGFFFSPQIRFSSDSCSNCDIAR